MTIKQQFKQAIKCGTGEAYFILKNNPTIDFSKIILDAAKINYAHDPQSEGSRAEYIDRLVDICPQKSQLVKAIIKALNKKNDDPWNIDQLFGINALFARRGNKEAKKAIYKRYWKNDFESDWLGQKEIVQLDGFEGLKIIAETRGKSLSKNNDDWEDGFFVDGFQKEYPSIAVYNKLKKASKSNKFIKKYVTTILKSKKENKAKVKKPRITYEQISENISRLKISPIPPGGISAITPTEDRKLASDFLNEPDDLKKEKYLRIFAKRKYPFAYQPILEIAKGKNNRKTRLLEFACESLKFFEGKDIRSFTLKKLKRTNKPANFLFLLVSNYKKGDAKLLASIATKYKNQEVIHELMYGLHEIYLHNKVKECRKPLEIIYRKMNCGIHRYELLQILHKNKTLSKPLLREMQYDSYNKTNEWYQKLKKG